MADSGQLEKAFFKDLVAGGPEIYVLFNPEDVSIKKTVPWSGKAENKEDSPKQQFTGGQSRTLSIKKLEFDTSGMEVDEGGEPADVRGYMEDLLKLTKPNSTDWSHGYPPLVLFSWGLGLEFVGVVKSMNSTFTKFNPDGIPIRAHLSVDLLEVDLEAHDYGVSHTFQNNVSVKVADATSSIQSVAGRTAVEQEDWREVADLNSDALANSNLRTIDGGTSLLS